MTGDEPATSICRSCGDLSVCTKSWPTDLVPLPPSVYDGPICDDCYDALVRYVEIPEAAFLLPVPMRESVPGLDEASHDLWWQDDEGRVWRWSDDKWERRGEAQWVEYQDDNDKWVEYEEDSSEWSSDYVADEVASLGPFYPVVPEADL